MDTWKRNPDGGFLLCFADYQIRLSVCTQTCLDLLQLLCNTAFYQICQLLLGQAAIFLIKNGS